MVENSNIREFRCQPIRHRTSLVRASVMNNDELELVRHFRQELMHPRNEDGQVLFVMIGRAKEGNGRQSKVVSHRAFLKAAVIAPRTASGSPPAECHRSRRPSIEPSRIVS
jgi:hypothetical protein